MLTAAALYDLGESARDFDRLDLELDGNAVTVSRPDGSRIISVPLERLFHFEDDPW